MSIDAKLLVLYVERPSKNGASFNLISQLAKRAGQPYNPDNKHGDDIFYDDDGDPVFPPNDGAYWPQERGKLEAGTYVDRYGREEGVFLSPVGTGFENRSLPARNIPSEYHVFKVIEDLSVNVGKILPWFGHPGNGIQFKLLDGETTISSKHMQKVR